MRPATSIMAMCFLFPFFSATNADVIHVPGDQPTIQAGIDAAGYEDTVIVAPGWYDENIDFINKRIKVLSSDGPYMTVIDGNQSGTVVTFDNRESSFTVLEGFTIRNGRGYGGGIYCEEASPTLTDLIIRDNESLEFGGGMYLVDSNSIVRDCRFLNNRCSAYGGGLQNFNNDGSTHPKLIKCLFEGNEAPSGRGGGIYSSGYGNNMTVAHCIFKNNSCGPGYRGGGLGVSGGDDIFVINSIFFNNSADTLGGALYLFCQLPPVVTNCTIVNNSAASGGAIYSYGCDTFITNCILWNNSPDEIYNYNNADPMVSYSNVMGGYPGLANIDLDPLFVDEVNGDIHLKFQSPCKDSGNDWAAPAPTDFEDDPRIALGNVDIGADEFYTHLYVTGDKTPGGSIQAKFVGLPSTTPVGLFIGSGVLETPQTTMWGDYWLEAPWRVYPLIPIPTNGILVVPATIPLSPTKPYDVPMQALIGLNPDALTNLEILRVE